MEKKKKKEDSPGDLRYETLIKIISSASVGCRDAYTTASRECNDLNGNNSVKDGCSLARSLARTSCTSLPVPRYAAPAPPLARSPFCTNGNKKPGVGTARRVVHERVTSSFGRGGFLCPPPLPHLSGSTITEYEGDKNDRRDDTWTGIREGPVDREAISRARQRRKMKMVEKRGEKKERGKK